MRKGDKVRSRDLIINDKVTTPPKPKYISDVLKDDEWEWINSPNYDPNEIMLVEAGTGTGKSTFAINCALQYSGEVLYLSPRTALKKELETRILEIDGSKEMDSDFYVRTYQELEEIIRQGNSDMFQLWGLFGGLIIVDEFHYFMQDSDFNSDTILSYNLIKQLPGKKIFLSGTGHGMTYFRLKNDFIIKHHITLENSYSPIKNTYFYEQDNPNSKNKIEFALNQIKTILTTTPDDKIIYFVDSMKTMQKLYADSSIKEQAAFYSSAAQQQKKEYREMLSSNPFVQDAMGKQTFEKRVLVTTSALDVGIDLKDYKIKHIFIDIYDFNTIIQCIGRKRVFNNNDYCDLYIGKPRQWRLEQEAIHIEKAIEKAKCQKELLNGSLLVGSKEHEKLLKEYLKDEALNKYTCTYEDWIFTPGTILFNELKYNRLQEKNVFLKYILTNGYVEAFSRFIGIDNNIHDLTNEKKWMVDEDALKTFIENNMEKKLLEEQQEELVRLCNIPNSRKKTYLRQSKPIREFLLSYGVRLENVRNQPYWIMHSA